VRPVLQNGCQVAALCRFELLSRVLDYFRAPNPEILHVTVPRPRPLVASGAGAPSPGPTASASPSPSTVATTPALAAL